MDVALWSAFDEEDEDFDEFDGGGAGSAGPAPVVTFPSTVLDVRVLLGLDADLSQPPNTWGWVDITQWVRVAQGIATTQGRPDESQVVRQSSASLVLDNTDGRFSRRNANGPYYGQLTYNTPIWGLVNAGTGFKTRLAQYVTEWPTRWDRSGNDVTMPITCAGVMRRLAQRGDPTSPMRRAIHGNRDADGDEIMPTAYWPMEEGSQSTVAASGLPGGHPTNPIVAPAKFGAQPIGPSGSPVGADFSGGGTLVAETGLLPAPTTSGFEFEFIVALEAFPTVTAGNISFLAHSVGGGEWGIIGVGIVPQGSEFGWSLYLGSVGSVSNGIADSWPHIRLGQTYHIRILAYQDGIILRYQMFVDGLPGSLEGLGSTLYSPSHLVINPVSYGAEFAGDSAVNPRFVASLAFWNFLRSPALSYRAGNGYGGETAVARIIRVCADAGIPLHCTASTALSPAMGQQPVGTDLEVLHDAEAVDGGVLYETDWGLGYQSLAERTNAAVALALDFNQEHIAVEPEPADDDQRLHNRWRVTRPAGSVEAVAELTTGPLGTEPTGPGLYDNSTAVNVLADSQLGDQAGWRLHVSTVDEDRWPSIATGLHNAPELVDTWCALPFGARVTVANPPAQMAGSIDALIEGWSERWDWYTWSVVLNTAPFTPYRTGTLANDAGDTSEFLLIATPDTLTLAADVDTTDTSWSVTASPLWTVDAEDFPRLIWWEGEIVTLTNCTGGAAPQAWTVTRSTNGVVKAHLAGSTGRIYRPGVLALA